MNQRLLLGPLAVVALIASGAAVSFGNTPAALVFLLGCIYWCLKVWRPDL